MAGSTIRGHIAASEADLVQRLRDGDERAFEAAVERLYPAMIAVARTYVHSLAVAHEVVQHAWLGVIRRLEGCEGRSSLRVWVLQIVANISRKRAGREARSVPFVVRARRRGARGRSGTLSRRRRTAPGH